MCHHLFHIFWKVKLVQKIGKKEGEGTYFILLIHMQLPPKIVLQQLEKQSVPVVQPRVVNEFDLPLLNLGNA